MTYFLTPLLFVLKLYSGITLIKIIDIKGQAEWCMPVTSATQEEDVGGLWSKADPSEKQTKRKRSRGVAQLVVHFPKKHLRP
jgi:hypothetical protein